MRLGVRLGPVSVSGRVGGGRRHHTRQRRAVRPLRAMSFHSWLEHPVLLLTVGWFWWALVLEFLLLKFIVQASLWGLHQLVLWRNARRTEAV